MKEVKQLKIQDYNTKSSRNPFRDWVKRLRDTKARSIIRDRIYRISNANFGDYKQLNFGVYEIRIHYGPGYRVYFGKDEDVVVILLCGGDKRSQKRDINKAKEYWNDYNQRKI